MTHGSGDDEFPGNFWETFSPISMILGEKVVQPKQCFIWGEIPRNCHTLALFDPRKTT